MTDLLKKFRESSALYGSNASYIEALYEQYLENPHLVEKSWQEKFSAIAHKISHETPHSPVVQRFARLAANAPARIAALRGFTEESVRKQAAVSALINHYRVRGHQLAENNPLGKPRMTIPDLEPYYYGLSALDMDTLFDAGSLYGADRMRLRDIIATLREIYCGSIGCEYMHIVDTEIKRWIMTRLEAAPHLRRFDAEKRRWIFKLLVAAESLEHYLHRKYVGQKRFSLEGGECLIPILDELVQRSGAQGAKEIVIGMAHRGRLNVLVNILGKRPSLLFSEFEGNPVVAPGASSGDVKYHMGFSSDVATPGGPVHLTLAFNPSHLEIINPVVEGSVKARQDRYGKNSINTVIPILIHGDAAFAGQGIVMETLNMSETRAFSTGGTVHIIINNQIGFTTSHPFDARSTLYCTDVANMIQAPVFHVNGDDPDAVLFVTQLALDYRMKFNRDVVIDLVCYRRLGHNEADEPAATQPMMYKKIRNHPTTRQLYAEKLLAEKVLNGEEAEKIAQDYVAALESGQVVSRPIAANINYSYGVQWQRFFGVDWQTPCDTTVTLETIQYCDEQMQRLPPGFELHPRVAKIMESRHKMAVGAAEIDWGFAENMAYATLLMQGYNIRLTGQDVGRGTFFHRHAILYNQIDGAAYIPLKEIEGARGRAQIFDSLLSEAGVLGFEYGYSSTVPDTLVIWEAQFGDFANNAQVVIDQFISSGEAKWGRLTGLTLFLPHGFEGQGPEHSSARLERYLQLCAEHNMQVCVPTTPAQIFHLLRRQMLRSYRKPLIVMSPKSLLRHKLAVSTLEELAEGGFQTIIDEIDALDAAQVQRLVLCTGKVYYDLLETRRQAEPLPVAIVRVEQLYPFPRAQLEQLVAHYPSVKEVVWCQEEPQNQGAWYQIRHHLTGCLPKDMPLRYAGRPHAASPAVGYLKHHIEQQQAVVTSALHGKTADRKPV